MNTEVKNSIGSNILSKENISFTSEEDMKLKQANIQGKNITINSKKDILIESGVLTLDSKRSSQSLNGEINLLTGQFNVGGGLSKDKSNEKIHTNTQIYGENIAMKSEDLRVKGGNIEADKVDIEAKNLHLESMQDTAKSSHLGLNISVGTSSVGGGVEYGKHEKEWVEKQSTIIGREKSEIDVAEKTNIIGAVIGGADTTLRTKELEFSNIEDKEKGFNVGMNTSTNIKLTNIYNETDPNNPNKQLNISKSGSASYDAVDREQINRATIGAGRIIVDGKEANPSVNRDESKAQEITKDVSVDKVGIKYSDNKKEWSVSSIQDILGEDVKQILTPVEIIRQKLRDDSKEELTNKKYVAKITKKSEDFIDKEAIPIAEYDGDISEIDKAHINGMNTTLKKALDEVAQHYIMKHSEDYNLEGMEVGETRYFILHHNESGLEGKEKGTFSIADLYESAIDKFGVKGSNKIYSKAAQDLAENIWKDRGIIKTLNMFSQGNIQYYAALNYIEEKYGVGALKELKIERILSAGSPLNAFDLISYVKEKEMIKNPNFDNVVIKNDNLDLVTNIVGFNGTSIITRDKNLRRMIEEKEKNGTKYDIWTPHSYYMYTTKPNSYIEYRTWQKPFLALDKVLRIMNSDTYRRNSEKLEINKGADRNENIK